MITIEETPNNQALKFVINNVCIAKDKPFFFNSIEETMDVSDLAKDLFLIGNVNKIFFGHDFIIVTKMENIEWRDIKSTIFLTIANHISNHKPFFVATKKAKDEYLSIKKKIEIEEKINQKYNEEDQIIKEILSVIEERIRPMLLIDGGDVKFINFVDNIVYIQFMGACLECPDSNITLQSGIERTLKHFIPEVEKVVDVDN